VRVKYSEQLLKIVAFILFTLLFTVTGPRFNARAAGSVPAGYTRVAENDSLVLYVNTENLAVVLEEKYSGRMLSSEASEEGLDGVNDYWRGFMRSGFAVEFFNGRSPLPERADAYNGSPAITVNLVTGGFDAGVFYPKQEIGFDIQIRLTSDGMTAEIPASSVRETETMKLCAVYLYQFMGAAMPDETDGYLLLPEGAGALVDLKDNQNKYKSPYQKRIYGTNIGIETQRSAYTRNMPAPKEPVPVLMPIYGIAHTSRQTAFLAIAQEGAYNADILAYPNGVVTRYNWAAIRFIYREQYIMQTTRATGILTSETTPYLRDVKLRFILLTGDRADYSGMALAYRNYLTECGYLTNRDTHFRTRIDFLGAETKKWLLFDQVTPMTTVKQLSEMLTGLADDGVTDIYALYRGWQQGGLTKNYGSGNFSMEGKLGRLKDLEALQEKLADKRIDIALYQDFLLANEGRLYNTSTDIVKGISQMLVRFRTYAYPFDSLYYFTPLHIAQLTMRYAGSDAGRFPLAAGSLGDTLFSYYSKGAVYSRGDTAEGLQAALDVFGQGSVALESPFMYMLPHASVFLDMPLYTSHYNYLSEEVPFLPMVLSGSIAWHGEYVNFQPNENTFLLKMAEYGAYPSFLLTGSPPENLRLTNSSWIYVSGFDIFRERIKQYSEELRTIREITGGSAMARHDIPAPGVARTTYENDAVVIVNYNDTAYTDNGVIVAGKSFRVVGCED
jgi:hypothetical protein